MLRDYDVRIGFKGWELDEQVVELMGERQPFRLNGMELFLKN
jgi:hypothetical protein